MPIFYQHMLIFHALCFYFINIIFKIKIIFEIRFSSKNNIRSGFLRQLYGFGVPVRKATGTIAVRLYFRDEVKSAYHATISFISAFVSPLFPMSI